MANVTPRDVDFLWEPYFVRGAINLLEGDPNVGKTFLFCELAAAVSSGRGLPGQKKPRAANVLFMSAEDELAGERRVVLLEAEERPGMHTTGRSVSVHSETYGSPCVRLLSRGSRDHFLEGVDGRSFASDRGCLYLATEAQIERLDAFGGQPTVAPSVERIGEAEVRSLNPLFRPGVVVAALYERHAYSLDVDAIHAAYLKRFRRAGGVLQCSARVAKLDYSGGQWMVEAGSRNFRAPVVVNAAGAWGDVVAGMAGVRSIGLQPMRRTVALVDAPTGVEASGR